MKIFLLLSTMLLLIEVDLSAQFSLSGDIRPRFEFRNGYRQLASKTSKPAAFVSQRSRLILDYAKNKIATKFSIQDVRVWGDEAQLSNVSNISVHEAWAQLNFNDQFNLRMGRQELVYDGDRLLGNVDWIQQARSHDAMVFRFNKNNLTSHMGLAYNNESESLFKESYNLSNYRAMGFLWLEKSLNSKIEMSFMSIVDALESNDELLHYRLTLGPQIQYRSSKYALTSQLYYQLGEDVNNTSTRAFLLSLQNSFTLNSFNLSFGGDLLSGTDALDTGNRRNNTMNTLYATNHKFYGLMDYFINIPSDTKGGGLVDIFLKFNRKLDDRSSLNTDLHYFLLANNVQAPTQPNLALDKGLGFELDAVYSLKIHPQANWNVGWSFMIPTETMRILRNGEKGAFSCWAWTMIIFRPEFLNTKEDNND